MINAIEKRASIVSLNGPAIIAAVAVLKRAFNAHTYVPILSNLLITCDGDSLKLRSTDLEITAEYTAALLAPAEPFATTIPLVMFANAIKGAKLITLECDGDEATSITVTCDGMRRELRTLPAAEYPPYPVEKAEAIATPTATFSQFIDALKRAASFAADEVTRGSVLMGTRLTCDKRGMILLSTDGFRMGRFKVRNCANLTGKDLQIILPNTLAPVLAAIKQDKKAPLEIAGQVFPERIHFEIGAWNICARLVDGQYPNAEMVIPKFDKANPRIILNRKAAIEIIKAATQAAGDRASCVRVQSAFAPNGDAVLTVTAQSDAGGAFEGSLQAIVSDEPFPLTTYNGKFLVETLNALTADHVTISTASNRHAAIIFNGDENQEDFAVIMPLKP